MKLILLLSLFLLPSSYALEVGLAHPQKIILPSADWQVKRFTEGSDLEVRLVSIIELGGEYEYSLELIANKEGKYNLLDFLRDAQSQKASEIKALWLKFDSEILADFDGELIGYEQNIIELKPWYQSFNKGLIIIWALALCGIIFIRKRKPEVELIEETKLTLGEYLLSKLELLNQGKSNKELWQEVELACIQFCRERLALKDLSGEELFDALKKDAEVAPLILTLEKSLHGQEKVNQQSLVNQIRQFTEKEL
ncbi:hypothetical protein PQO03_00520 [Lentisphaera profundi]|uniref:Uncharacterized protein n=1 Tax=Lentisphaera profundi TaxID=1658616 RepID=A0ABY7VU77_9BACT|nr:hypothetical protein [Lentisphaera profundi]WDE96447.1 hypothetical protein PQO03_00520 [Lentisphaera profundi]